MFRDHPVLRETAPKFCIMAKQMFYLRGSVTRCSTLGFFHKNIRPGLLIKGVRSFCISIRIREEIRNFLFACGVNDTACTKHAVSLTPHVRCMRGHWLCMQNEVFEQLQKVKIIGEAVSLCKRIKNACGISDTGCKIGHCIHNRGTNSL
jgi:hypothetical protein